MSHEKNVKYYFYDIKQKNNNNRRHILQVADSETIISHKTRKWWKFNKQLKRHSGKIPMGFLTDIFITYKMELIH